MKTWHMIIDLARCHDCNDCFLADKDEFVDNEFPPYSAAQPWHGQRWMDIKRKERGQYPVVQTAYLPMPCMHCDEAPCLTDDGAVYRRDDGLVIIDPVKAVGRREIAASCPYNAIYWNEERQLAQKCTGCAHLLDGGWAETRCSHVCPTDAIKLVLAEDEEMAARVAEEGLERYRDGLGTRPRVYYRNLHRWTKAFVAGAVVDKASDECAEGVGVVASRDGQKAGEATTDNYGGFLIDRLEPGAEYTLTVEGAGYRPETIVVDLKESRTLGPVFLGRAE
ncbi:MAG TPA: 4Fe-4S dicluster domain-containing protein [Thermoleophilia bacterium]|nr:4Fe-4S dicluster domain-containing protein [Thermoleophilia bacterium]